MPITLHLTPDEEAELRSAAGKLRVSAEALAATAVRDLLARPDDDFLKVAKAVVDENRELYERLK